MEAHDPGVQQPRRRAALWLAILALTMPLASLGPGATAGTQDRARMVVGFHDLPDGLGAGDRYKGAPVLAVHEPLRFAVVETEDPDRFRREAQDEENVRYVDPDHVLDPAYKPNDPRWDDQWNARQVDLGQAWERHLGDTDRNVCIVDSGIRYTHDDLKGNYLGGGDTYQEDGDPWDPDGHGTFVSGIAAAGLDNGEGIAGTGNVGLLVVRASRPDGRFWSSDVAEAIDWCRTNDGDVVNLSLGSCQASPSIRDAVNRAWDAGLLLVAAAGNENPTCGKEITWPAKRSKVVAVTCTTRDESLCSFSARGSDAELAAPGKRVLSTCFDHDSAYCRGSGTSASSPHVAGIATLVWSYDPTLDNQALRTLLQDNAKDRGADGRDNKFGFGIVDAGDTIAAANDPPTVDAGPDLAPRDSDGSGNETVHLDGSGTTDPEDDVLAWFEWRQNGTVIANGSHVNVSFPVGTHTVTLAVADEHGAVGTDETVVDVLPNRRPLPSFSYTCRELTCTFDGTNTRDRDGEVTGVSWDLGDGGTAETLQVEHTYQTSGTYHVSLTATDAAGDTGTLTRTVVIPVAPVVLERFDDGKAQRFTLDTGWRVTDACQTPTSGTHLLAYSQAGGCQAGPGQQGTAAATFQADLGEADQASLAFMHHRAQARQATSGPTFEVQAKPAGQEAWQTLETWDPGAPGQGTWQQARVPLDGLTGGAVDVRFVAERSPGISEPVHWYLDDVGVLADGPAPTGAREAPLDPPERPPIDDPTNDVAGQHAPAWMDIERGWLEADARTLYVGLKVRDLPPAGQLPSYTGYAVDLHPTYPVADPSWGGAVTPGGLDALRAHAIHGPGMTDGPVFRLVAIQDGVHHPLAQVEGQSDTDTDVLWWKIPRNLLQDPLEAHEIDLGQALAAPAVPDTLRFGGTYGDDTAPGGTFAFPAPRPCLAVRPACTPQPDRRLFDLGDEPEGFETEDQRPFSQATWDPRTGRIEITSDRQDPQDEIVSRPLDQAWMAGTGDLRATARFHATSQGNWQRIFPLFLGDRYVDDVRSDPGTIRFTYMARDTYEDQAPLLQAKYRNVQGDQPISVSVPIQVDRTYRLVVDHEAATRELVLQIQTLDGTVLAEGSHVIPEGSLGFTAEKIGAASYGWSSSYEPRAHAWVDDMSLSLGPTS